MFEVTAREHHEAMLALAEKANTANPLQAMTLLRDLVSMQLRFNAMVLSEVDQLKRENEHG